MKVKLETGKTAIVKNVYKDVVVLKEKEERIIPYDKIEFVEMTKNEFVLILSSEPVGFTFGIWKEAADIAFRENRYDEYISHWLEQDDDEGSRNMVKKMLTRGLYEVLQSFREDKPTE